MTTVALPLLYAADNSGKRIFHGVVGIDVLASDFGASLDDSALALKLQQRSYQCVSYDFSIPEGENVINTCQITEINPSEPYVPTGATIHEVDDNHCKSDATGAIIAIVLGVVGAICCTIVTVVMCRRRRGKQTAQTVNKSHAPQLVQMTGTVQHTLCQIKRHMDTLYNGSMRMHKCYVPKWSRMSAVQQAMQQPYQQPSSNHISNQCTALAWDSPLLSKHNICNLMVTIKCQL